MTNTVRFTPEHVKTYDVSPMPYPARIEFPSIITAALRLLERDGPEGLTMRALARDLDVSAPSLYFHVESRDDLLHQLIADGLTRFGTVQREAIRGGALRDRVRHISEAYIAFAEAGPQLFTLIFGPCTDEPQVDPAIGEAAFAPVLELAAEAVGEQQAPYFAEAIWSLVHGYTVLRLAAQFQMNPDHEAGFWYAIDLLLSGAKVAGRVPAG